MSDLSSGKVEYKRMQRERKQQGRHKRVEYGRYGYFFIAPFFIIYLVFSLYPMLTTVYSSFFKHFFDGFDEIGPTFIGLDNYKRLFIDQAANSKLFDTIAMNALRNTVIMWIINFIPQVVLSILLAVWFTDTRVKIKGQGAFKILTYLPNLITAASIAALFSSLFAYQGSITIFLRDVGIISKNFNFMESKAGTRIIVAFINFWMWYGNTMLLMIAGILGISPALFEAAQVDGASSRQTFWHITFPLLKPITLYVFITSAIGGLQMYDIPAMFNYNAQNQTGNPNGASTTIIMYLQKLMQTSKNYGRASSIAMMLFILTLILSFFFLLISRDRVEAREKRHIKKAAKLARKEA